MANWSRDLVDACHDWIAPWSGKKAMGRGMARQFERSSSPLGGAMIVYPPAGSAGASGSLRQHPASNKNIPSAISEFEALRSCIAALHKMCLRIAQLLAIKPAADARDGLLPFHRISCSPLKVLTFTPKGPRFSDGPIFLAAEPRQLLSSPCGMRRDSRFSQQALGVISPWRNRLLPIKV